MNTHLETVAVDQENYKLINPAPTIPEEELTLDELESQELAATNFNWGTRTELHGRCMYGYPF